MSLPHAATLAREAPDSVGSFWKVYPLREAGKALRFSVVALVAPNAYRKCRIPPEHATREARAAFARGAANALRRAYEDEQREARERATTPAENGLTFEDVGLLWTSGKLHAEHPDHVKKKKSANDDAERLAVLSKAVGPVPMTRFSLDDAQRAMRALPATVKSSGGRRHYAQVITRVCSLAVFPLRIIERSPIPRGFLPKSSANAKAKAWLYPAEDALLVGCADVPLWRRMLWGVLAREGMREGEALGLTWEDLDLERGVVRLDTNKTNDPRTWALSPDVTLALAAWRERRKDEKADAPVFVLRDLHKTQLAEMLRADVKLAGVEREELQKATDARLALRVHDLRATFVTLALAADRTEAWVTDRTGHRSSDMVHRYKRTARTARELGLGWLVPLDVAVGFTKPAPETPPEPTREREPDMPTRTTRETETAAETVTNCLATVSGGHASSSASPLRDQVSPPATVGTTSARIAGAQEPTRCRGDGSRRRRHRDVRV